MGFPRARLITVLGLLIGLTAWAGDYMPMESVGVVADRSIPAALKNVGIDQNLNQQVPLDLPFRDEAGKTVLLSQLMGSRPAILVLAYYDCPRLCTVVLNHVAQSMRKMSLMLGADYSVITVSIDPKETPALASAKKAAYLKLYGSRGDVSAWHFLTGSQDSITRLARAAGSRYAYDPVKKDFLHASGIMVLTPSGKLSHYFFGLDYPPRDLRLSLVAASSGRIGSPVDRILLFCCDDNPSTGKYDLVISRVVNILCTGVAIALFALLLLLFRSDRWRAKLRSRPKPAT